MIYLASSSPRRAELLNQIKVEFTIVKLDIDETAREAETAEQLVMRLSAEKARKSLQLIPVMTVDDLVLAADTVISLGGQILGKPSSTQHCCRMLTVLSGQTHQVLSAIAVVDSKGRLWQQCSVNEITFRHLEEYEVQQYCQLEEPMDKAGAYAIQGKAAVFIEHLSGSYSSVMGLPLFETAQLLKQAGYSENKK